MELNEAIRHDKEVAENWKSELVNCVSEEGRNTCLKRAAEHEQRAEWLTELQERRATDKWISVKERLPEKEGWYLVDRKERIFSIQCFFFGTADHKPYWSGASTVYYWRPLPQKPEESEDK